MIDPVGDSWIHVISREHSTSTNIKGFETVETLLFYISNLQQSKGLNLAITSSYFYENIK